MANFGCTLQTVTESDPLSAFRTELIARREALPLNPSEAAERAGITAQRWAHIERGWELKQGVQIPANPRRSTLLKMAHAVHWPADAALRVAGFAPLGVGEMSDASSQEELVRIVPELSESQRRALLYVARSMRDSLTVVPLAGDLENAPEVLPSFSDDVIVVDAVTDAADRERQQLSRDATASDDQESG